MFTVPYISTDYVLSLEFFKFKLSFLCLRDDRYVVK